MADIQECRSVRHLQVHGNGSAIRYVPLHSGATDAIATYLDLSRTSLRFAWLSNRMTMGDSLNKSLGSKMPRKDVVEYRA